MSSDSLRYEHELDGQLADARLFAWLKPAFRTAVRHWPIALGAGFATLCAWRAVAWLDLVPWYGLMWLLVEAAINGFILALALSFIEVITYRLLLEKERLGVLNDWRLTLIRTTQITFIWWIAIVIVVGAIAYLSYVMLIRDLNALGEVREPLDFVALYARNRFWDIVQLIVYVALVPVMASIAVAAVLSNVHAIRSRQSALDSIRASFRLAFDQRWRVFWGSLVIALLAYLLSLVGRIVEETDFSVPYGMQYYFQQSLTFASAAFGLGLTFVIERAYAAHLTLPEGNEGDAPQPAAAAASAAPSARNPATSPNAGPQEIAAAIADALRKNQIHRLAESVERGLAADKSFFVSQPDSTLVLAKRLDAQRRSDLALRIALPYLKTQRGHRQHFTTALFVADVLSRDPQRLSEAARFLAQVKAIYPREPMLDQMIKKTDDAIAAAESATGT